MTQLRFAFVLVLLGCGTSTPTPKSVPQSLSTRPQVDTSGDWIASPDQDATRFKNGEGVRAYLLPVHSKSRPQLKNRYLFRITGSQSPNDGLVVVVWRSESPNYVAYRAQLRGEATRLLGYMKNSLGPKMERKWSLYGYDDDVDLGRLRVVNEPFDVQGLLQLRERQQREAIGDIETSQWADIQRWQDKHFQAYVDETNKFCGQIESTIDWKNVQPQWTNDFSIARKCAAPLLLFKDLCKQNPGRLQSKPTAIKLTCTFGDDPKSQQLQRLRKSDAGDFIYLAGDNYVGRTEMMQYLREQFGETLQVLRAAKLHVVINFAVDAARLFHGDGETFYPLGNAVNDDTGETRNLPGGTIKGALHLDEQQWVLRCGDTKTPLEVLRGKDRDDVLKSAKFEERPIWQREPYFLARDSNGNYYYVDRYQADYGGGRYRVFVGRKGELKLSKLRRLVEDTEGTLFSTSRGDLRLIVSSGNKRGTWIKGKKAIPLASVQVQHNKELIYDELGVYFGVKTGFICE